MQTQAVNKPKRPCVLRSVVVNTRRLIVTESLFHILGREPTANDPLTVTIAKAQQLSGLSRATIGRMIKAGEAADVAA
jgi:hypothetical protein